MSCVSVHEFLKLYNHDGSLQPIDCMLLRYAAQTVKAAVQRGQGLRPVLQHIYETRARSYRDAVQEFVDGYKEGYVGQPVTNVRNQTTDDMKELKNSLTSESDSSTERTVAAGLHPQGKENQGRLT